jgi:hypothetical protein
MRDPHILKQRTACSSATLTHPYNPKTAIPRLRFAIALPSHLQQAIPRSCFAIALPQTQHPTYPNSELLAAALRYRTPHIPKQLYLPLTKYFHTINMKLSNNLLKLLCLA